MQDTKKHYSGYNCIRSGGMKIMKTMEDVFNEKLDEKQDEIDTLKEVNEDLIQQLVVTQEAVDFLLMGGM